MNGAFGVEGVRGGVMVICSAAGLLMCGCSSDAGAPGAGSTGSTTERTSGAADGGAVTGSDTAGDGSGGSSVDEGGSAQSTSADPTGAESGGGSSGSVEEGWTLVWSDEFDGEALDATRWTHERNCWGGGNGEQQCYTDAPENSFVADGMLHIVARMETTSGPGVNDDHPDYDPNDTSVTLPYASARLRTRDLGDWHFGRVEVRARLPFGQGTWPAIWMLPTARVYGGWAASGEIDIMEAVNLGVQGESRIHGTLHYGSYWPNNVSSGAEYTLPGGANPADDFHDYAIEWEEGEIRWYVDDHHFATQRQDGWYTLYEDETGAMVVGEGAAPFDEAFHLILNLAVGGAWAGNVNAGGIDPSVFPQELTVDYVRVFACSVDLTTGDGCDTVGEDATLVPGNLPPE